MGQATRRETPLVPREMPSWQLCHVAAEGRLSSQDSASPRGLPPRPVKCVSACRHGPRGQHVETTSFISHNKETPEGQLSGVLATAGHWLVALS